MSAGIPWVDNVMYPLWEVGLLTASYNRIYEAVSRGTEEQGKALVAALIHELNRRRVKP